MFKKSKIAFGYFTQITMHNEVEVWMAKGSVWSNDIINIYATGSNDSGVSWIVEVKDAKNRANIKRIFHAGDLNNWYARFLTDDYDGGTIDSETFGVIDPIKDEKQFLGELKDIKKITDSFDVVMFPA